MATNSERKRTADLSAEGIGYSKESKVFHKDAKKIESDEEEDELEAFLFGGLSKKLLAEEEEKILINDPFDEKEDEESDLLAFEISTKPSLNFQADDDDEKGPKEDDASVQLISKKNELKPAWKDPDDDDVSIDINGVKKLRKMKAVEDERKISGTTFQDRLKANFEKVLPAPAWADINAAESGSDDEGEEEIIFKSQKKLLTKPDHLQKGIISISKLKDLNRGHAADSTITNVKFHPSAKIALTASMNKNFSIYQVDGRGNQKLQSTFLSGFPIYTAAFTPLGDKVVLSSRRKYYYIYDMIEGSVIKVPGIKGRNERSLEKFVLSPDGELIAFLGNNGYVNLVSMKTSQWISSVKMNGIVEAASFSADSSKLLTAGSHAEVYIWDVKSRKCEHRFMDDGAFKTTSIGVSRNGQYVALGSNSGVVNIYDEKCYVEKRPSPIKALMNLTTSIDGSIFNSSSEILGCYSPQVRNALKLVHFPSLTTFSNWPKEKQTLGNISCIDFSPKSGYLGIGNEKGRALLFRLNHYPDS